MLLNNRIFLSKAGTLRDLSSTVNDIFTGGPEVLNLTTTAGDALYIGSDIPFNHRYFQVIAPNAAVASLGVQVWTGSEWQDVVDIIDQTKSASTGATLAHSGIISWVPNRRAASWAFTPFTEDMPDLASLRIYDFFWVKIKASASLTGTTSAKYIAHKFSGDTELFAQYPDFADANFMAAFKTGKTNWDDQSFLAAEQIIQDLRGLGIIWSSAQILDWQVFSKASIHKTAQIIYNAMGDKFKDNRAAAAADYKDNLQVRNYNVDSNANADLEPEEKTKLSSYLTR